MESLMATVKDLKDALIGCSDEDIVTLYTDSRMMKICLKIQSVSDPDKVRALFQRWEVD